MTNPIQVGIRVTLQNQQETTAGIRQIGAAVVETSTRIEAVGTQMATALNTGTDAVNRNVQAVGGLREAGATATATVHEMTAASTQEAAALNLSTAAASANAESMRRTSEETASFTRSLAANRQAEQSAVQVAAQLGAAGGQLAASFNAGTEAISRNLQVVNYWGETETEATRRVRDMVAASAQETAAINLSSNAAASNAESIRRTSEETANYTRSLAAATAQMSQASAIAQPRQVESSPEAEKYVAALQRQLDLVGRNAAEQAQYQARLLGGTKATQDQAASIVQNTEALRQQIAAEQRNDQAATQFIAKLKDQAATLGMTRSQLLAYQAAELGVADAAAPMIARLQEAEEAAGKTGHATAGVKQELIVLAHEAVSGNFSRMPGSFMVLAEQMNVTASMINPLTIGFVALAIVVGDLAYAYSQAHEQMIAVNNVIAATSNFAGVTQSSVHDLAESVSADGQVTIGVAKEIVTALAASGRVGSDALAAVAGLSVNYAKVMKKEISEVAPELARLFSDPLKGAEELNSTMHFLTATDIEHIRTLKELGLVSEAQLDLATKLNAHLPDQAKNVHGLEAAWNAVKNAVSGFNDQAGLVLNGDVLSTAIKQGEDRIALFKKMSGYGVDFTDDIAKQEKQTAALRQQQKAEQENTKAVSDATKARDLQKTAQDDVNKSQLTRIQRLKEEQELVANAPDSAAKVQRQVELQREIAAAYRSMGAEDRAMSIEQLGNQEALRQIKIKGAAEELSFQYQIGGLNKSEFDALMNMNAVEQLQSKKLQEQRLAALANLTAAERQAHVDRAAQIDAEIDQLRKRGDNQIVSDQKKAYDDVISSIQKAGVASISSLDDQIAKQKQHNAEIGKTKAQIESAKQATVDLETAQTESDAAYLRNAIAKEGFDDKAKSVYEMRLAFLDREIASRHTLSELLSSGAVLESNAKAAEDASKAWEKTTKSVQQNLADAIANGGGNAWKKLKAEIANQVLTVPLQLVGNTVASLLNPSAPQVGGQTAANSSLASNLSLASSGYKLYGAGFAGIGSGITSAGSFLGSSTVAEFGAGFSGSAGAAAEALGGSLTSAASAGAGLASALSTAIPYVAAAVVAYKAWNALFDDGPESDTRLTFGSNNAAGHISINERGNEGKSDSYIAGASTSSSFGTFGVTSTFWAPAESETVQNFVKTVGLADDALAKYLTTAEKASVTTYLTGATSTAHVGAEGQITSENSGKALAQVFTDRMLNILEGVEPGLSKLEANFQGTSAELATEVEGLLAYRAALRDSGQAVFGVQVTLQQIAALKTPTESTSAALQRITDEFNATNQVAQLLGKDASTAFGSAGLASEAARAQLILLSGGISNFTSQASSYAQSFLTEQQRLAPMSKALNEQLAQMSLTYIPQTKNQFAQLVSGLDLSTEAGQKTYASLMGVQEAFAQVHASEMSAADEAKAISDLQSQLYEVTGDKAAAAALLERQHIEALADMTPALASATKALWDGQAAAQAQQAALEQSNSLLAIQAQIYDLTGNKAGAAAVLEQQHIAALVGMSPALADATKALWSAQAAAQAQKDALEQSNSLLAIQAQIYELTGNKAAAAAVLEQQHQNALAALDPSLRDATQQLWNLQAAAAKTDVLQSFGSALADTIIKAQEAAKQFRSLNDALLVGDSSALSPEAKYAEAKRQFETADNDHLAAAENAFLEASKAWFGGSAGYAADFAAVIAKNSQAAAASDSYGTNAAAAWAAFKDQMTKADGSHFNGLDYVPFNNYRAILHEGERVQTASSVRAGEANNAKTVQLLEKAVSALEAANLQRGAVAVAQIDGNDTLVAKLNDQKRAIRVANSKVPT